MHLLTIYIFYCSSQNSNIKEQLLDPIDRNEIEAFHQIELLSYEIHSEFSLIHF